MTRVSSGRPRAERPVETPLYRNGSVSVQWRIDTPSFRYSTVSVHSRIGTSSYRYYGVSIVVPPRETAPPAPSVKGPGMECRTAPAREPAAAIPRPPLVRELLLVAGLFLVYKFGRLLAGGHTTEAFRNAHDVWGWERALGLPDEGSVQSVLLHDDTLVHIANVYYATVHFPATAAFLIWLYLRRPGHYTGARRALAALTAAALLL
ncbi:phosphatase PAP2 family protein, partial [Streptomyces caniscabiei]|uniref:phosphatase PAP2 family protein n=1 Tax=Streptomyces caniscabiei TaxID=2746961 RepID=UPI003AF3200B